MGFASFLRLVSMLTTARAKSIFLLSLLGAVALYATWPLFGTGFIPTHDGEYHIIRFWQFARVLGEGHLFPRWAPDLNSGYGIPLFIFHYPFPNYVGFFLHSLGLSFVNSFQVALALGYFLSITACYLWLSRWFSQKTSVVASIITSVIPYWFVDIYVRGSIGEVWAIAWFFVILAATEHSRTTIAALASTFLILSHNILAMVFMPLVFAYIVLRNRPMLWTPLAGIIASSYFWIPALAERGFVTGLNSVNFADHFPLLGQLLIPSWGTGFSVKELTSDEMSFQIGIVPLIVIILSLFARSTKEERQVHLLFLFAAAVSIFLMLDISKPLWDTIAVLPFIQYPWRFLAVFLPVVAFLAARVVSVYPKWIGMGLAFVAVLAATAYMRPVVYAPRTDAYYLSRPEFTDGTSSIGNTFSTIWTPWKSARSEKMIEVVDGKAVISEERKGTLNASFSIRSEDASVVSVHTLYYPGWTLIMDGKEGAFRYKEQGTLLFDVPDGTHTVSLELRETPLRKFADSISFLCLLWLSAWAILKARIKRTS